MFRRFHPLAVGLLLAATTPLAAQQQAGSAAAKLDNQLTLDPKVRTGVLPNGLHYFVRANAYPPKRAELRLAVNAGSILEDDDQRGMAHVIEHMGFNGSTHFKKNELVSYMQSIGMRLGPDVNAYTSFDETVYMLKIPTDTARIVEQAFTVLEDWAHGQIFDSTEVANERGVVREEWRGGKGTFDRMRQQYWSTMFRGSRYADRFVIGTDTSIMSSTVALLKRFYTDWYRPDMMAVVAVGDFDAAQIEGIIKQHFTGIPAARNPRPRIVADVPGNTAPLIAVATDKEAPNSQVQLMFKLPLDTQRTVADYRRMLASRLASSMISARLAELSQKSNAPFAQAFSGKANFVRQLDVFQALALVKEGDIESALTALVAETKRVDQFGFLQSELDRAKQNMLRQYERGYAERDKTPSTSFASEYVSYFLQNRPAPGIEAEFQLSQQLIPAISLADVSNLAKQWISDENRVLIVESPLKDGVRVPTQAELRTVLDQASKATVVAYTETVSSENLIAKLPPPGKVTTERRVGGAGDAGVTEWQLSNGARVLFKTTDFKADQILFGAWAPGGTSLVSDADYMSAIMASQMVYQSGLAGFNRIDLGKKLSGKQATVFPNLSGTTESLNGQASPKDLETLLQLTYLTFTAPRYDTAAVAAFKNQYSAMLNNRGAMPEVAFNDTFTVTMGSNHVRARPLTAATFVEVNPQRAYDVFRERFADASGFTFVFVGNVDPTVLKPLAEQYLAALPALGRKEAWRDVGVRPPTGVVEKMVRKGTEAKSATLVSFTGPFDYSAQNNVNLQALIELMRIKLIATLREQMSATYSPGIFGGGTKIPRPQYTITLSYGSSPENVEPLTRAAFAIIDSVQRIPPSAEELGKVKEALLRAHETDVKQNGYWLSDIISRGQNGDDISPPPGRFDEIVKGLTSAQIQAAAKQYFNMKNYVRVVLVPETKTTP